MKQVGTREGGKRLLFSLRCNRWLVSSLAPPAAALPGWLEQDSGEKAQRKRQVTEGESGGAGQWQLCAETLRAAGPQSDAEPQRRAGCEVRSGSAPAGAKPRHPPRTGEVSIASCRRLALWVRHPHPVASQSHSFYSLNDVEKRICLFSFFPMVVLFLSRKKMRVSSAEIHQMWARRISPIKLQSLCHPPIGNSTGLIIWYHVSTFFFQKLSSSYFVPFK